MAFSIAGKVLHREFLLLLRKPADYCNPLLFFMITTSLFPLAITPDPTILQRIGPGVIWVAILLAVLLSLNDIFQNDYNDGHLEEWVLSAYPLTFLIFLKVLVRWLVLVIPLTLLAPLFGLMFFLHSHAIVILMVSLWLAIPLLFYLGAMIAALTVSLQSNGLLLALLLFPLYIPPLIFSASAVSAAQHELAIAAQLAWLGVLLIIAITFAPFVAAASLRIGLAAGN